ncbi:MAG: cytochrome P450, partial [Jannaschia sp.]
MFDLRRADFLIDPGPLLAAMRAEGPVVSARLPVVGRTWLTTTDAAARALLKDETHFARDPAAATGRSMMRTYWWLPRRVAPLMENIILKDGADHARLRSLVSGAFARTAMDHLRPAMAVRADALLDRLDTGRPVDLVPAYTKLLPFEVICDLLGFDAADLPYLRRAVAPISSAGNAPSLMLALLRLGGLMAFLRKRFDALRNRPAPGLMSALVEAREGGDRLSEDELLAMVMTIFIAGHETTVHLLNDCLLTLIDRPDLRPGLSDPSAMALFVEEAMRHWTPAMLTKFHFARVDCDLLGVPLPRGARVGAFLLAANHDPERVADPGGF